MSMIDEARFRDLGGGQVPQRDLGSLREVDLRRLRRQIDDLLPSPGLGTLNLEEELVEQYRKTKAIMDDVMDDDEVQANQKAQVANSVVSTLAQLVKLQEDMRREETLKIMEDVFTDLMKVQPEGFKQAFFAEYEARALKAGLISSEGT